jgi:hypothetical protein
MCGHNPPPLPLAEHAARQAVPKDAKPIKSWPDEDEAFDDVVAAIERAVQTTRQRAEQESKPPPTIRDSDFAPELAIIPPGKFLSSCRHETHDPRQRSQSV